MARSPVRMPAGFQNVDYSVAVGDGQANYDGARQSHPLFMFPAPYPFRLAVSGSDFLESPPAPSYVTTVVGSGTAAPINSVGGVWQLTTSAGATDSVSWQRTPASFNFLSTLQGWFHTRVTPSDATNSELLIGITITDTTPLDASDGFFFHKASGSTAVDLVLVNATVVTTIAHIADMVDATAIKLSLYYDGKGTLSYYVDNNKVNYTTNTAAFPLSTVALTPTFHIKNGAAAVKNLQIDHYMVAMEVSR